MENLLEIRIPVISEQEQQRIAEVRERTLAQIDKARVESKILDTEVEAMILGTRKVYCPPSRPSPKSANGFGGRGM